MPRRFVAALLWFLAVWFLWDLGAYFTGAPRLFGPVFGFAAAALVTVDPRQAIWTAGRRNATTGDA
jgi:hypothetical protein